MEGKGVLSMYTYSIFSVKAKIAAHYFYKTGVVYRFLKEYRDGPNYKYLQSQYNYVIEPITLSAVASYLQRLDIDVKMEKRDSYMKVYWEDKSMTIYEDGHHLEVTCTSIEDVEDFFFPILRKSPGYFFVISNRLKDFGWLSVKNNRMMSNQILYSFR